MECSSNVRLKKKIAQHFPNLKMFGIKKIIGRGMAYLCSEMPLSPGDKQLAPDGEVTVVGTDDKSVDAAITWN